MIKYIIRKKILYYYYLYLLFRYIYLDIFFELAFQLPFKRI